MYNISLPIAAIKIQLLTLITIFDNENLLTKSVNSI